MTREELLQLIDQAAEEGWETLDLAGHDLEELPPQIGKLTQLKTLILGKWNGEEERAEGNRLSKLPDRIVQLTNLQALFLSNNSLSSLPKEIVQLTNLQSLDLSDNSLSSLPQEIAQLTRLRSLNFSGNSLNTLPAEIGQLTNLQELSLSSNSLITLPTEIGQLTNLEELNLIDNSLITLPAEITQLVNLLSLYLSFNSISTLSAEIGQLTNLQALHLSSNFLSTLPVEIGQLIELRSLNLRANFLSTLPAEIIQLTNLQSLNLSSNSLSTLPAEIIQLTNLRSLNLRSNSLSTLPAEIGQLTNLQSLDLSDNPLGTLPTEIAQLRNLQSLDLRSNSLNILRAEIGQLTNLRSLSLSHNSLSRLPAEVGQLTSLRSLYLSNNSLSTLPAEIKQLSQLEELDLRGNPIPIPPEVLGPKERYKAPGNVQAILDFYFQVQDPRETEPLYEAKVLIVGEGGAGKTSLGKKIQNEAYELESEEKSTEGIEVIRWSFTLADGQECRVNLWDFGGQEIYHATHQFFLTKRSVYALVADTRQENTDFYYWLNVVELLSDNSPVMIIKNEKQDRQCPVNERQLRGEFTSLEKVLATNLQTNRGLAEIKDTLQRYVLQLPHIGTPLPKIWVRVRAALENYAQHCNYISDETYFELCELSGFSDRQNMLQLSSYLHDLGVCLHFQDDDLLKKTIILKPAWGTRAVYKVLDTPKVKANYGKFTRDDLAEIWSDAQYADMHGELLKLMMRFKLCYEIRSQPHHYISPQLLDIEQPAYDWDEADNLILRYDYDFMPKGILTRFTVEMHRSIEQPSPEQSLVWKEGVILNNGRARAEVIEYYHKGEIRIRVSGHDKKAWLSIIDHEFEDIHRSYERLKYKTLVPCNCLSCKGNQTPHFFSLKVLQKFLDDKQDQIQCQTSYEMVRVRHLVDDVNLQNVSFQSVNLQGGDRLNPRFKELSEPKPMTRNQVFISYSHQDQEWLTELQKHLKPLIRKQTVDIWDDTKIQAGAEWRNEIETALVNAKVAVLMVSPNFLASDFIADNELPPLLDAAQTEGLTVIWIPISYSMYEETEIEKYQSAYPPNQPLDSLSQSAKNQAWVNICKKIKAAANS